MKSLDQKFASLGTDNAPGQEVRQRIDDIDSLLVGEPLIGEPVDFSHGDVDAFQPAPSSFDAFAAGVRLGGRRAYTEYRGDAAIRGVLADRLADFTGSAVSGEEGLIVTPGTQGALFLALASTVGAGDKVAIVEPDYFANRKLVRFLDGEIVPVTMNYPGETEVAGLDLSHLERVFADGVRVFVFSNPNNPTGVVYGPAEIAAIAELATRYGVTVIVDQLYARQKFDNVAYTHLRAQDVDPEKVVTIMGPSKTESLSGYRLGVAFGASSIISRMEKLQAIVSLRAGGYSQSVLETWFAEPVGWLAERIALHQAIRDELYALFGKIEGVQTRLPQAGSYLFPKLPKLSVSGGDFARILRHQASVIVTPGTEFGPQFGDSIRLNFSQDHRAAAQAVDRVALLVERYRL